VSALSLFPDTAAVDAGGELVVGGVRASALAAEFGTPLVVYCEKSLRARARAYRAAAPDALVVFGTKAFPNVALLRLLAEEGLGADVATGGELEYALRAGIPGERIVVHGNNKSLEELRACAAAGVRQVVVDAPDEVALCAEAGVRSILVRTTLGIDVDTHDAINTAHHGSKFGLPPELAMDALEAARAAGIEAAGLHVHLGSQLLDPAPGQTAVIGLLQVVLEARERLGGWTPTTIDLGGGLGIAYTGADRPPSVDSFAGGLVRRLQAEWDAHALPQPRLILEPGRSIVGQAGFTLYRVGVVKATGDGTTYVAVDGGMSDNPRPQLYDAVYEALLAERAAEPVADGTFAVCGKHCESGDVLIEEARLPQPRRGDLLAVPATGAYTLSMGSNYNALPRPAAVMVAGGRARMIRRRETLDDLLALEV
jgi:diaminopimelate decarboxylase